MLATLRSTNLLVAFLLELALLAAVGFWGFHVGGSTALSFLLGIGGPLVIAVLWGALLAPRAPVHLQDPLHLVLVIAVFGLGVAALFAAGQPLWAWVLALVFAVNRVLLYVWKQKD